MNIISEKECIDRMTDGIHTILSLPKEEFESFILGMQKNKIDELEKIKFYYSTDGCELKFVPIHIGLEHDDAQRYYYYSGKHFSTKEILEKCTQMMAEYDSQSEERIRLNRVVQTRDLNALKSIVALNGYNTQLVDKTFEVLSNNELLSSFLDYDKHIEDFSIDGENVDIKKYIEVMHTLFGDVDKKGNFSTNVIDENFLIPNAEQLTENFRTIISSMNVEREFNPAFTFRRTEKLSDQVIRADDEPCWNINPEIKEAILGKMPDELSPEEKALYIYVKACLMFQYDDGYMYRDRLSKVNYESSFSKEHLEKIKLGDKITCFDFSRIYIELVKELDEDITPVMILTGVNEGHALAGFYTAKGSATLEAINFHSNDDITNDLMKSKNGIRLKGVNIISDKDNLINPSLEKVSQLVFNSPTKSIKEFVEELRSIKTGSDIPDDISLKIESLIEIMKAKNVTGNEFTQTIWGMRKSNYFGTEPTEMVYLGELVEDEKRGKHYKRHILLRKANSSDEKDCYMIDTELMNFSNCQASEIKEKLGSGQLVYEDKRHKLSEFDKGESR